MLLSLKKSNTSKKVQTNMVFRPKSGIDYLFQYINLRDRLIRYYDDNCYVTFNYDEGGLSATIQMFECTRENGKKRGGGLGKKLLYNVLKHIRESTQVIMIELLPVSVGENSNNNESKLIKYYEKLGFKQINSTGNMNALLDDLLIKLNPKKQNMF